MPVVSKPHLLLLRLHLHWILWHPAQAPRHRISHLPLTLSQLRLGRARSRPMIGLRLPDRLVQQVLSQVVMVVVVVVALVAQSPHPSGGARRSPKQNHVLQFGVVLEDWQALQLGRRLVLHW